MSFIAPRLLTWADANHPQSRRARTGRKKKNGPAPLGGWGGTSDLVPLGGWDTACTGTGPAGQEIPPDPSRTPEVYAARGAQHSRRYGLIPMTQSGYPVVGLRLGPGLGVQARR